MTWLISKALMLACKNSHCSPARGGVFSEENYLDGKPSAPSSGENTPLAYCAHDKMKAFSRLSRFGMTLLPFKERRGEELLTWYLAGFPVKTSALPEKAQASPASVPACGATWRGSLAKYDPASLSWKTAQRSLLGDLELSSVIWPRSGMTADGQCWELPTLERTTKGIGSGLWQTPVADDAVNRVKGKINSRGEPKLSAQVIRWPTPLANSHTGAGHGPNKTGAPNLQTMVKLWPTPTVNDSKNSTLPESQRERDGLAGSLLRMGEPTGGQLNPMFVEWLMGFPQGWTELKRLEMPKCHSVPQPHGNFSLNEIKEAA